MRESGRIWLGVFIVLIFAFTKTQAQTIWADVTTDHGATYRSDHFGVHLDLVY